jgi:hypothetical protein
MKKVSVSKYKKKLDGLFSLFIRLRGADINGYTSCFTCGVKKHYKELQCGHFVPRQYLSVRYSEINCQTQCYACNMLYNGQPSAFALRLTAKYGDGIVAELEGKRKEITKYFPYELKIEEYKEKLKEYNQI